MNRHDAAAEDATVAQQELAPLLDELAQILHQGDRSELDEFLRAHPSEEPQLRRLLPTMRAMAEIGSGGEPLDAPPAIDGDGAALTGGKSLGDFRLIREVGRGGMGVVYEAEQLSLGRRVALKILPLAATLSARQMQRFKNEARAAATLRHPHIVGVHSIGVERGVHYYAMEFIEGCTLADAVRERGEAEIGPATAEPSGVAAHGLAARPPSGAIDTRPVAALSTIRTTDPEEYFRHAARLIADAAEALDYAHGRGIIHRDIKPANLLIDADSQVWVADFGLALLESDVGVTMSGDLLGTLRYMSPEQISPTKKVVDERTDVYSLGATLFELATGRPLFGQTDRAELIRQIAAGQPRGLRQRATQLPVDLKTIVAKAVERDPADRYQSAQHMADDLRRFLDNRPILARPPSLINQLVKWSRRHVKVVWAALAASLLIAALSAGGTVLIARSSQEAHRQRQVAIDEKQEAQRNLYRANVQIAHYEWDDGRVDRTLDLLDAVRPSRGETDYRCWEWYYVKSLCHKGESIDGWLIDSVPSCPVRLICRLNGDTRTFLDWESGEVCLTLVAGFDDLHAVVGPAGRRLACAIDPPGLNVLLGVTDDASNWLRVYDLRSRSKTWEKRVTPAVTELAWSPGGDRIVTAHHGGRVSVWDANNGSLIKKMAGDAGCNGFENVKWSPDGRWIAVGHGIWDAASGAQVFRRITESDAYRAASGTVLDWHPSEQRLATVNREQLSVWNLEAAEPLLRFRAHRGWVQSVAWAPDGKSIATAGNDSLVKVWDGTSGKLLNEFRGHTGVAGNVRWLDGGKRLASRSYSETTEESETKIWDLNAEQRYRSISPANAITWTPSGTLVASSRDQKGWTYDFVDPNTGSVTASIEDKGAASNVMCLSIDRAGRYLASSNTNGNLQVRDIGSGELLGAIKANARETRCIAWSPDGSMLATSGDDGFKVWNVENHEQIAHLIIGNQRPPEDGDSVIWSLDGRFLVGVKTREIRIWKTDDWREVTQIHTRDGGDNVVNGLSWSPTGDRFVSCTGHLIDIWGARSGRNLMEIKAHNTGIMSVAWSPDGRRIASGGRDHLIKVWDADTGEDMLTLRGHEDAVIQLAWSPDGRKLASSDGDSTRIWDATKGHLRP